MASPVSKPVAPTVLSLEVLARETHEDAEQPTQFRVLVRHFLECFFRNELLASDGDVQARLVQAAFALGIPGFVIALYLYTPYHLPHQVRAYWSQAGDHYFYVLYAFVAMGLVAIFEWDLFFPGPLDMIVLSPLPVRNGRMFRARITAILVVVGSVLVASNVLAPVVLPAATDPPHLFRFLAGHLTAVTAAGLFAAGFFIGLEGLLLAILGSQIFRRASLWLQGISVCVLLTLLFLYPVFFNSLGTLLQPGSSLPLWLPPFWFLGIYQRIVEGPATPAELVRLAHLGTIATAGAVALAAGSYPLAWRRRTRGLMEGGVRRDRLHRSTVLMERMLHLSLAHNPAARAIWHFVSGNLVRVARYRMYLVMYGGAGAALVVASIVRAEVRGGLLIFHLSTEGVRAAIPIIVFWTVSGLRTTFSSTSDQQGRWIFRTTNGRASLLQLHAAMRWVFWYSVLLSGSLAVCACAGLPHALGGWKGFATQMLVAVGLSLLLTDAFFLNADSIPFTESRRSGGVNFALLLIPYFGFFPVLVLATTAEEPWIEAGAAHLLISAGMVLSMHLCLELFRRRRMAERLRWMKADEDEEDFPMRLGLRY